MNLQNNAHTHIHEHTYTRARTTDRERLRKREKGFRNINEVTKEKPTITRGERGGGGRGVSRKKQQGRGLTSSLINSHAAPNCKDVFGEHRILHYRRLVLQYTLCFLFNRDYNCQTNIPAQNFK